MINVIVSMDTVRQMVAIINQNHRTTIARDSIQVAELQTMLIEQRLIRRTDLYTCEVITR
jgi:hypothetical protein